MRHAPIALALALIACGPAPEEKPKEYVPVVPNSNKLVRIIDQGSIDVAIDLENDIALINNANDLPAGTFVVDTTSEVPQVPLSDAYTDKNGPSVNKNIRGFYCGMKYEARVWLYNNLANAILASGLKLFGADLYNEVRERQWIYKEYVQYGQIICSS